MISVVSPTIRLKDKSVLIFCIIVSQTVFEFSGQCRLAESHSCFFSGDQIELIFGGGCPLGIIYHTEYKHICLSFPFVQPIHFFSQSHMTFKSPLSLTSIVINMLLHLIL